MSNPTIALAAAIDTTRANVHAGYRTDPATVAALLAGFDRQHDAIERLRCLATEAVEIGKPAVPVRRIESELLAANVNGM